MFFGGIRREIVRDLENDEIKEIVEEEIPTQGAHGPNEEDEYFEKMSKWQKAVLYGCFLLISVLQISQTSLIFYAWEPYAFEKGMSNKIIVYLMGVLAFGAFIGGFLLKGLLKFLSRRMVWAILVASYGIFFYHFASISSKPDNSLSFELLCTVDFLFITFAQNPLRTLTIATTSKMFPTSVSVMIQILTVGNNIGNFIGPFSAGVLLNYFSIRVLFYFYTTLVLIPGTIGFYFLPKTSPKLKQKNESISTVALYWNHRGLSNLLCISFNSVVFRIFTNQIGIYLKEQFGLETQEISFVAGIMMFGSVAIGVSNVFFLKYFDHRLCLFLLTNIGSSCGYFLVGGLFWAFYPTITITVIGMIFNRFIATAAAPINQDLIIVAEELQKRKASIATRDTITISLSISMGFCQTLGSAIIAVWINFWSFQLLLNICGVLFIVLGINYLIASKLYLVKTIFNRKTIERQRSARASLLKAESPKTSMQKQI